MRRTLTAAAVTIGAVFWMASGASAATTRYTTPTPAAGPDCTAGAPCSLEDALAASASGDTIVVGVGTYADADHDDDGRSLTIRGAVIGPGRPTITGTFSLSGAGTRLSDVALTAAAYAPLDVQGGAVADRVLAVSGLGDGCTIRAGGTITNSVCRSDNPSSNSAMTAQNPSGSTAAHNVTLIGYYGYFSNNTGNPGLTLADAIARNTGGGGTDIRLNQGQTTLINTNYATLAGAGLLTTTGQQTTAPVYRGPGDLREDPTSPTIDAGSDAAAAGELDLNGNARKIGTHADMGAYEYVPAAPSVGTAVVSPVAATTATLTVPVDAFGGRTTYRLDYGPTAAFGSSTPSQTVAAGATSVRFDLSGLTKRSTVHYRIVAASDGGTTTTGERTFATTPLVPTATIADATAVTTTAAALHGAVDTDTGAGTAHFVVTPAGGAPVATPDQATGGGPVDAVVSGLAPGTTYSYVLVVHSAEGDGTSTAAQFATVALPPVPAAPAPPTQALPFPTKPVFTPTLRLAVPGSTLPVLNRSAIAVVVGCAGVACTVTATGVVTVGGKRYGSLAAPKLRTKLAAGGIGSVKVTSTSKLRAKLRRYLAEHSKAKAVVKVTASFAAADGTHATKTLNARVRLLAH
jgi:hypothetical protein